MYRERLIQIFVVLVGNIRFVTLSFLRTGEYKVAFSGPEDGYNFQSAKVDELLNI